MIKFFKIILYFIGGVIILGFIFYFSYRPPEKIEWGVNFSPDFAKYLGFDARKFYVQMLNDLHPKYVRLMAYWEDLEANQGKYDLPSTDTKFILDQSAKRGVKVILVLGHKQPRWPECHHPAWYEKFDQMGKDQAVLTMLETSVNYFKNFSAVEMWQIENEPYFKYGPDCPVVSSALYKKEIALVKKLDSRPVVATDSGEKGFWLPLGYSGGADILGSTLYRTVYSDKRNGYLTYPLPAFTYRIKAGVLRIFSRVNRVLGVELQAEPWFNGTVYSVPWEEQAKLMNPQIFYDNIKYAARTGMERQYFWGVEWWYWAKTHGHKEMWDAAKEFFEIN